MPGPKVEQHLGPHTKMWFETYRDLGYRLTSIAAYGKSSQAGYIAVYLPVGTPDQHLHVDVFMDDVDAVVAEEAALGYYPTQIAGAWGRHSAVPPTYALVFERLYQPPSPPRDVILITTWDAILIRLKKLNDPENGNVLSVDAYTAPDGSAMYCMVLDRDTTAREQWKVEQWLDIEGAASDHPGYRAMRRTWSLPRAAISVPNEREHPLSGFNNAGYGPTDPLSDFLDGVLDGRRAGEKDDEPWQTDAPKEHLFSLWKTETLGAWPDLYAVVAAGYPPGNFDGGIQMYGPFTHSELGQFRFTLEPEWWIIYIGACGTGSSQHPVRYMVLIAATGSYWPLDREFHASVATPGKIEIQSGDMPGALDPDGDGADSSVADDPSPPVQAKPKPQPRRSWPKKGGSGPGDDDFDDTLDPPPPAYERVFQGGGNPITEPDARTPSITIGVAFNQDNLSLASEAELVQIAAAVEKAGYWPDGDLFQQT